MPSLEYKLHRWLYNGFGGRLYAVLWLLAPNTSFCTILRPPSAEQTKYKQRNFADGHISLLHTLCASILTALEEMQRLNSRQCITADRSPSDGYSHGIWANTTAFPMYTYYCQPKIASNLFACLSRSVIISRLILMGAQFFVRFIFLWFILFCCFLVDRCGGLCLVSMQKKWNVIVNGEIYYRVIWVVINFPPYCTFSAKSEINIAQPKNNRVQLKKYSFWNERVICCHLSKTFCQ